MTTHMTPDEIRALLKGATGGSIIVNRTDNNDGSIVYQLQEEFPSGDDIGGARVLGYTDDSDSELPSTESKANATLWAAAPRLAAEAMVLAEENGRLREALLATRVCVRDIYSHYDDDTHASKAHRGSQLGAYWAALQTIDAALRSTP